MNGHQSSQHAPSASNPKSGVFAHFYALYRERQDALSLIRQINRTIRAAQRHRGISMGLLGGNTLFREEFERLQQELERRILALKVQAATSGLLSERDQENLDSAWLTVSRDWQEDPVIDNYELHCHLIEQLLAMLASLSRQLEQPITELLGETDSISEQSSAYPSRFKHLEVLHFTTRLLPAVVEQIGRIRALGTYAAAAGYVDAHHDGKLRYVIQCTRVNNEKLRHQIKRLEGILDQDIGLLSQLKSYELKLMFLLNMVETDILHEGAIHADSNRIYNLATDIIDVYLSIVDNGMALIDQWHDADMEHWLAGE